MRLIDGDLGIIWTESIEASHDFVSNADLTTTFDQEERSFHFLSSQQSTVVRGTKRSRTHETFLRQDTELPPNKKRRLRVDLITSMLSRPFAAPSTYIPARRSPRAGPWARQRVEGRDLLRKAAIFNKIAMKRRTSGLRGVDHRALTRQAALIESCPPHPSKMPSRSRSPHDRKIRSSIKAEEEDIDDYVPFDAFDLEEYSDDEEDKSKSVVYSDFNTLRSEDSDGEDREVEEYSFDSFDTGQGLIREDGEKVMIILKESEKLSEVSLAPAIFTLQNRRRDWKAC